MIDNAVQHSDKKGTITLSLKKKKKNAVFSVKNPGEEIPPEIREKIFERFYRVDKDRARETGGSGLGLHIVRRIALLHKGNITVESKKGEGSRFTLILPITISSSVSSDD